VPGWRIGWILLHDPLKLFGFNIAQVLKDACTTSLAPSSITQAAVPTILRDTPKSFYDNALEVIEGNALLCAEALGKIEGLKVVRPRGSLYMLVGVEPEAFVGIKDEWDFVQKLVWEEAVFPSELTYLGIWKCADDHQVPGKCFRYEGYMRIVTASKREDLVEACVRLEDFCRRHRK
jgi:tyrosine aminotransferase